MSRIFLCVSVLYVCKLNEKCKKLKFNKSTLKNYLEYLLQFMKILMARAIEHLHHILNYIKNTSNTA